MPDDLRTGLVEAIARSLAFSNDTWAEYWDDAVDALDAALGFLTDNAEAWPCHEDTDGLDCICIPELIAALSDSRDTERPEVPDMSTKREDLYVMGVATSGRTIRESRPATTADLVTAFIAEGGETIWWCENHAASGNPERCEFNMRQGIGPACRMVEKLLAPIPVESAEAKETP